MLEEMVAWQPSRGGSRPLPIGSRSIGVSLQPAIPRRVAPQQSPLPLHQSPTIVKLKLTRLGGAVQAFAGGSADAQDTPALLAGIPPSDGRTGPRRTRSRRPCSRVRTHVAVDPRLGCAGRPAGG